MEVEDTIARASRAFGELCKQLLESSLSLNTKRLVHCAVVLHYGAEAWINEKAATRKLESFKNKCLWHILEDTKNF